LSIWPWYDVRKNYEHYFENIAALLQTLFAEIENEIPEIENPPKPRPNVKTARPSKPTREMTNRMLF
jgi:hypothetical protein